MEPELSSKGGSKAAASSMSLGGASSSESKEAKDAGSYLPLTFAVVPSSRFLQGSAVNSFPASFAAPAASSKGELPWVEKYRPRTLKGLKPCGTVLAS